MNKTIVEDIQEKILEFGNITGLKASHIYLGENQWQEYSRWGMMHLQFKCKNIEKNDLDLFMGCRVHRTFDQNHLNIA